MIDKIKRAITSSFKPTIKTVVWLMKLMLPITLAVAILDFMGVIVAISEIFEPLFNAIGLRGEAAIVYITSALGSIYAAIGVMAGFGFDLREVTIMATMCLICHNLIIETKVQQKAGSPWWYIVGIRLIFGIVAGYALNLIIPNPLEGKLLMPEMAAKPTTWAEVFLFWSYTILPLTIKVLIFVALLNILQGILKEFNLIDKMIKPLQPFMRLLGLAESTTFLWIVVNTLGLAYGAMVMSAEIAKGEITKREARLFNTSAAMNHSMLEDSLLFMALGVAVWWVLIPRLVFAIGLVWLERGYYALIKKTT